MLQEAGIGFARTHNLLELLRLVVAIDPTWEDLQPALSMLVSYAIDVRSPGMMATRAEARPALPACRPVRDAVRLRLGLPPS